MIFAIAYTLVAAALAYLAFSWGGWGLVLLWPAVSFGLIAAAYFGVGPVVFGKRPNGTLALVNVVLLLPCLLLMWSVWGLARIIRRAEPPFHELVPGVWIGRRLRAGELPAEVELVVDLTCEFIEPVRVRSVREYVALPTLDGCAPRPDDLLKLARLLAATQKTAYIHCAEGYGRTGVVAAALLLVKGHSATAADALAAVKARRPKVRLRRVQVESLERLHVELRRESPP